jgi:glutamine amidotransferase
VSGPNVAVLDYGSGNLRSAERALERAGADVTVTSDLDLAAAADGLVVPGVGAYAACMAGVEALGAGPVIASRVATGRPVLGICVGMQIMFEYGEEHGVITKGLGLLPGRVTRLDA